MNTKRFNLRKAATIVACLAVTTVFASCNKDGDGGGDGGGGKGRKLTAIEKELVGKYSYGSGGSGYWAYYSNTYDQWKGGWTYANGIHFKSDGTYESFTFASGSAYVKGGSLIKATANWQVPVEGTVRFTNMVENVQYADGTKEVWRQSEHPTWDPEYSYTFEEKDGKKGIRWGFGSFYEKE